MRRTLFEEEHELFRSAFRRFLDKHAVGHREAWERAGIVDRDFFQSAGEAGFLGFAAPGEFGGGDTRDFRYNLILNEEIQDAGIGGAGLGITLHTDICLPYFLDLTNDEQKARWLEAMASGKVVASFALIDHSAFRLSSSCGFPLFNVPTNALKPVDESSIFFDHV